MKHAVKHIHFVESSLKPTKHTGACGERIA
jgi:hypothetical protein